MGIKLLGEGNVVLDGLYSWTEYNILIEEIPELILISVVADKDIRYGRLTEREIRPLTKEEAKKRDLSEIEGLGYTLLKEKIYKTNKHVFFENKEE